MGTAAVNVVETRDERVVGARVMEDNLGRVASVPCVYEGVTKEAKEERGGRGGGEEGGSVGGGGD